LNRISDSTSVKGKTNQYKENKKMMKSLQFFRPTLATTLAFVFAWLLSVRPAQAGYTVTLQQVGPNVVATGSGAIDLTGLRLSTPSTSASPMIYPNAGRTGPGYHNPLIYTGSTSSSVDFYFTPMRPVSFGSGGPTGASSGSGDMVGIHRTIFGDYLVVQNPIGGATNS